MKIIAQGKFEYLKFLHPDYLSSPSNSFSSESLSLFDGFFTMSDLFFTIFMVALGLLIILVSYYYIKRSHI